jgi:hypothetical protein
MNRLNGWKTVLGIIITGICALGTAYFPEYKELWVTLGAMFGLPITAAGFLHKAMKADPYIPTGSGVNEPDVSEAKPYNPKK